MPALDPTLETFLELYCRYSHQSRLRFDIEVISKMYLVQFINPTKSLVAIHAVMSQKFGFACNDGDAPGVRPGG
ncbi:hypothetical protein ALC57_09924 [Trachymyrmex cornetzi]|uniref:Uncharacterized protein n=1 Tax=Trachymyrmex cornetzi TaxID=471704 RepID=A0A151J501_9HYME|nr:hypothetical protein ALC57_09924 [Trachymyrmex cornetzi]